MIIINKYYFFKIKFYFYFSISFRYSRYSRYSIIIKVFKINAQSWIYPEATWPRSAKIFVVSLHIIYKLIYSSNNSIIDI